MIDGRIEMARGLVQFRPGALADELSARHDYEARSAGVRRDLVRYYAVVQDELAKLQLTEVEVALITKAIAATEWSERNYQLVGAHVEALCVRRSDKVLKALAPKLKSLSPGACMALIDGAERLRRDGADVAGVPALRIAGLMPRANVRR